MAMKKIIAALAVFLLFPFGAARAQVDPLTCTLVSAGVSVCGELFSALFAEGKIHETFQFSETPERFTFKISGGGFTDDLTYQFNIGNIWKGTFNFARDAYCVFCFGNDELEITTTWFHSAGPHGEGPATGVSFAGLLAKEGHDNFSRTSVDPHFSPSHQDVYTLTGDVSWSENKKDITGWSLTVTGEHPPVPEPQTAVLAGAGGLVLVLLTRQGRRRASRSLSRHASSQ